MKRILAVLTLLIFMSGCKLNDDSVDGALLLRSKILNSKECSFDAKITADYGDEIYQFTMACKADKLGNVSFCVTEPSGIQGVTGLVSEDGGKLTFDDQVLLFELLADGQVSPVSAPWLMIRALRSGYIRACEENSNGMHIIIDDSYAQDALQLDVYTDSKAALVRGEILWDGRRIVSIDVVNFRCL